MTPYYLPMIARKDIKNFDIIHLHDISTLSLIVAYYAKNYDIPYIVHAHGSIPFLHSNKRNIIGRMSFSLLERPNLCNASKVIALTKTEMKQYIDIGVKRNRIEIVPNGLDVSEFVDLPSYGEFRKKFKIGIDEKIILYVGRLNESKGLRSFAECLFRTSKGY